MVVRKSGTHRLRGRSDRARIAALTRSLEALLAGDISTVVEVGPADELGDLELAAQQTVARLVDALVTVGRGAEALNDGWRQVLEMSNQMSESAEKTAAMADATAAASAQVSNNVQLVAASTEELGATIREVAVHASEASRVAVNASSQAATATATVAALNESSQRVEQVVELIQSIAGQTHLLALNATIEAARAGDAGLGFSVVASEVKSLASETARATGQVSQSVQEIQAGSDQAGRAITEISDTIRRVTENQVAIAAAVEQQTAATHEIGRGASEAAMGSVSIASNIARLAADARSTAYAGTLARLSATQIADVTLELERLVAGFDLTDLIAAVHQADHSGVTAAYVANGATVVQDSVQGDGLHEFDYEGSWAHGVANADANANDDGTNSYSSMTGDVATLRFVGTQIRYFAVTDSHHGIGGVSVDGGPEVLVDLYSAARSCGVQLWQSPVLAHGEHVLSVRVTGERNAQSRYLWVNIDRVEIV